MSTAVTAKRRVHPVDEVLPVPRLAAYGFQHVLAFYAGAVLVPILVAGALDLSTEELVHLINADLFTCGIASIIQSVGFWKVGVRLPLLQGVTFTAVSPDDRCGWAPPSSATAPRPCTPSSRRRCWGPSPIGCVVRQSDTDAVGHDTGAFGSAGSVVAGRAVHAAATALRKRILAAVPGKLGPLGVQCGERFVGLSELAGSRRPRPPRRHAALAGVQRARLPGGRPRPDRRGADPAVGAGGRRRGGAQSRAVPRAGRGRRGAGARARRCTST